jgi:hypothetical protein
MVYAIVSTGKTRNRNPPVPIAGSHPSVTAKTQISKTAIHIDAIDCPKSAKSMENKSIADPLCVPAIVPKGIANKQPTITVQKASVSVFGSRAKMMSDTGCL